MAAEVCHFGLARVLYCPPGIGKEGSLSRIGAAVRRAGGRFSGETHSLQMVVR